jgi:hypothetical protein
MKMLFGTNTWNVIPTAVPSERHLRLRVPCECIMSESYPTLEMEAVLCCPHLFSGRPSLRTLAHTLALRFMTLSLSRAVCMITFSNDICQI